MIPQNNTMTAMQAFAEAERCLYCFDAPCTQRCPVHIDIPGFISMIRTRNIRGASHVVKSANPLANMCGKVCPQEVFCQSGCTRAKQDTPIDIRGLHFFCTQQEARTGFTPPHKQPLNGRSVAVIGAGPAGLSCGFQLGTMGYRVTIYDKRKPGGVPRHSIPPFRLADATIEDDVRWISSNVTIRRQLVTLGIWDTMQSSYDAVYLAIGLGQDRELRVPGEDKTGVMHALEFLESVRSGTRMNLTGKRVVVIGGGNVSLDCAAAAKHLGAEEVTFLYRRGPDEMKVWKTELEEARARGVEFRFLTTPVEVLGKKKVTGLICRHNTLSGKKDASGRPVPVEVAGSEFTINADMIIAAVGQSIGSPLVANIKRDARGTIVINKQFRTSANGVFAGGDVISGEGTIVQSAAQGKAAAVAIDHWLRSKVPAQQSPAPRAAGDVL